MEFRKEKSEKSKELIKNHSKSNIFNIDTGYYKTEKIFPISPKPNEIGLRLKEFSPKYKEVKHFQRKFENLLSDYQKRSTNYLSLSPIQSIKHIDLEKQRTRNKEIKGYCYDKQGNFSSRKLYILDLYRSRDVINNSNKKYFLPKNENKKNNISINVNNNKSIKEKRKNKNKKNFISSLHKQKIVINDNKNCINNLSINKTNFTIKQCDKKELKEKEIKNINKCEKMNNNINSDIDKINSLITKLSTSQKKETLNYIKKLIDNNDKIKEKNKTKENNTIKQYNSPKQNYLRTQNKNKVPQDYDLLNIEIKNKNKEEIIDRKKVKNILFKNGLHVFDIDENEGNLFLYENNTIKAKIRKNKGDENFENKFKKAVKEFDKINIKLNKYKVSYGKKKRKGTPGIELKIKNQLE